MSPSLQRQVWPGFRISLGMVILPFVIFYTLVFTRLVNLPFSDDYDNVLDLLITLRGKTTLTSKLAYLLTAQHNEYKLFFENTIITVQYAVMGHANFIVLCIIGDLSILFLGIVLWKMFLPALEDTTLRLALFIPVSWMVFQLSYAQTLNWAGPGIQNLYIPVFSLATFLFLVHDDRRSFLCALACMVLSVATSGNGLIAAIVGMLMLLRARRVHRLLPWIATTLAMIFLYAFHYDRTMSQNPSHRSILDTLLHLNVFYILTFLGAAPATLWSNPHGLLRLSAALGLLMIGFYVYCAIKGSVPRNPAVQAALVFLLLTAIGVAGLRSDFGAVQSLSGRYKIYSSLLLIFVWYALAEKYLQAGKPLLLRSRLYVSAMLFSIFFSIMADAEGAAYLSWRKEGLSKSMALYEHPTPSYAPGPDELRIMSGENKFNLRAKAILDQSEQNGIYRPPALPLLAPQ